MSKNKATKKVTKSEKVQNVKESNSLFTLDVSFTKVFYLHTHPEQSTAPSNTYTEDGCTKIIDDTVSDMELVDNTSTIVHDAVVVTDRKPLLFLDAKKKRVQAWPTMVDTSIGLLPTITNKPCRHCHHTFNTSPVGCPIAYRSHAKKDDEKDIIAFFKQHNFSCTQTDYFITEHLFCTLSCVKAYIYDKLAVNPSSRRYQDSLSFLSLLFKKINDIEGIPPEIPIADNIEVLSAYGGHTNIEQYRNVENKHIFTVNIKRPLMFTSCAYIEKEC